MKGLLFTVLWMFISSQGVAGSDSVSVSDVNIQTTGDGRNFKTKRKVTLGEEITQMSGRKRFRVSMRSNTMPLSLSQMHSWTVHLESPDGKPIEDAKIGVYGVMPAHKHGLPTKPRVTESLGNGDYRIDGVKFNMPGEWELLLIITANGKRDKARFKIELP